MEDVLHTRQIVIALFSNTSSEEGSTLPLGNKCGTILTFLQSDEGVLGTQPSPSQQVPFSILCQSTPEPTVSFLLWMFWTFLLLPATFWLAQLLEDDWMWLVRLIGCNCTFTCPFEKSSRAPLHYTDGCNQALHLDHTAMCAEMQSTASKVPENSHLLSFALGLTWSNLAVQSMWIQV